MCRLIKQLGALMSIERLAAMFGGVSSYQGGARSTAGGALNKVEVAALLSGMQEHEVNFVYAFFGDAARERRFVEGYVCPSAMNLARREGWIVPGAQVDVLANVAVIELLHNRCNACNGTGFRRLRLCGHCGGIGTARLSGRSVANLLSVDHSNYLRTWKRRYDCIYTIAQDVQCNVLSKIHRAERNESVLWA